MNIHVYCLSQAAIHMVCSSMLLFVWKIKEEDYSLLAISITKKTIKIVRPQLAIYVTAALPFRCETKLSSALQNTIYAHPSRPAYRPNLYYT